MNVLLAKILYIYILLSVNSTEIFHTICDIARIAGFMPGEGIIWLNLIFFDLFCLVLC